MRPPNLRTKIFLDSGDPSETREAITLLGFLDGQTTNPSLIAKNPETSGKKFTKEEILDFYKNVVTKVSGLIPDGSVSIEVYADATTKAEEMLGEARKFFTWIPNAHIKFPTTPEGLIATEAAVKEGIRVNLTLCFSQSQAAAVYAATRGAKRGDVFVSPFIGRLDDQKENGMDLIKNIVTMYRGSDHHVEVLAASIRSLKHLALSIELGADIVTVPLPILKQWQAAGMPETAADIKTVDTVFLSALEYQNILLDKPWREYDLHHDLTDKGIEKFSTDWNALIAS
jgi:transaldolase